MIKGSIAGTILMMSEADIGTRFTVRSVNVGSGRRYKDKYVVKISNPIDPEDHWFIFDESKSGDTSGIVTGYRLSYLIGSFTDSKKIEFEVMPSKEDDSYRLRPEEIEGWKDFDKATESGSKLITVFKNGEDLKNPFFLTTCTRSDGTKRRALKDGVEIIAYIYLVFDKGQLVHKQVFGTGHDSEAGLTV